ncbi:transcriptional regulator family protein [Arabidopsis lyrata subsp. lyrata]|uniref:Transcriptional regulator family protein n=1 Tax=Arabidopsis lyrata subsp. lyrata TaxID=81972 RepID=D7KDR6_ARALL|nr:transcriptional regulator family protein [Arabidopsis lyrata subsp. lyrata]
MAPKKSEGIALLSVYSDEDDEEMEDAEEEEEEDEQQKNQEESEKRIEEDQLEEANYMDEEERGRGGEDSRTPRLLDGGGASSSAHATPRSLDNDESSSRMIGEFGVADGERGDDASGESSDTLLNQFLPPRPREKCSEELQRKIDKFLSLKKMGKSFNSEVRNRKEYRNPDFLLHAVSYQDIDQIGSCFSKDVFDPYGYDPSDFCDAIEIDMKHERERKEQESKKNQKLDFVSAGTQPGAVFAAQKPNIPIPGIPALVTSGLPSVPTEIAARDGRPNKKSKWDKVDGDVKNPPLAAGTQDSLSSIRSNAALVSAASAGSGYSAFAQQRRREVEGRRSSERKLERRS